MGFVNFQSKNSHLQLNLKHFGFAVLVLVGNSFSTLRPATIPIENVKLGEFVKIMNHTKQDIHIYTGSENIILYHGGVATPVSCENGKDIYTSDGAKKVSSFLPLITEYCGETVKLSAYL